MTKHKVINAAQLAELLAEYDVQDYDGAETTYPAIVVLNGSSHVATVAYSDFEPEEWMQGIARVLEWHRGASEKGLSGQDEPILVKARARLAHYLEYLGQFKAKTDADYVATQYRRRAFRDNLILIYQAEGDSGITAQARARQKLGPYDEEEVNAKRVKMEAASLYDTVKETLNAMSSQLRILATENKYAGVAG